MLSPQPWIGLQVSKHHYAREAAALGHDVIFANPPGGAPRVTLSPSGLDNITLIDHPAMPLRRAKFHARWLFDRAAKGRAKAIVAATGPIDLLWDFDNSGQFADHRAFGARRSILHAMDRADEGVRHGRRADLILGVAATLIDSLPPSETPRHVVPHGLAPRFAELARARLAQSDAPVDKGEIRIGFLGNLTPPWMDRPRLMALIEANPRLHFRFIGPQQDASAEQRAWVDRLRALPNVELAGLKTGEALVEAMLDVQIWLLCYDRDLDPNKGVNSHKLLEYFATGGEVVSTHIVAQADAPGIFMAPAEAPEQLAALLSDAVQAVRDARDTGWRRRAELALANSYTANFRQIAAYISAL